MLVSRFLLHLQAANQHTINMGTDSWTNYDNSSDVETMVFNSGVGAASDSESPPTIARRYSLPEGDVHSDELSPLVDSPTIGYHRDGDEAEDCSDTPAR